MTSDLSDAPKKSSMNGISEQVCRARLPPSFAALARQNKCTHHDHTDEAASSESSEANVEPGQKASDREDSESDAPYTPELDFVFDALVELAGDGRWWVPVRQIQAQTSLQLWRLEELLEEWGHLQG